MYRNSRFVDVFVDDVPSMGRTGSDAEESVGSTISDKFNRRILPLLWYARVVIQTGTKTVACVDKVSLNARMG